jgi:hypothetical protein
MRPSLSRLIEYPEVVENGDPGRVDIFGARLVARERRLVQEQNPMSGSRQAGCHCRAGRTAPDDHDLGVKAGHDLPSGPSTAAIRNQRCPEMLAPFTPARCNRSFSSAGV